MELTWIDLAVFLGFLGTVVGVSLYAGRKEKTSEDYFLAGRKLTWYLIGFSLIASNISTEHFVGMAGSAFGRVGLAIASYEWMAAVTLVIVGWWLLPKFLQAGIYTMPEFLEYRYDKETRAIMAIYLMLAYIIVLLAVVLYSGAIAFNSIFDMPAVFAEKFNLAPEKAELWANIACIWCIGIIAATYTIYGGLKSVVWSDLLQGGALILGGAIVAFLGVRLIGEGDLIEGCRIFASNNADKLHMVLPWDDPDVPWLAVFIGGLWIPNLFYWGLNQFITQRTLGARSLSEGQKGIILAALIKLLIPFIIVMPGIMAFQLYGNEINALGGNAGDKAYPFMISRILPPQLRGIMFAALLGAVMSTFNSGLNSASTIFTIDIYGKYINKTATTERQVLIGRIATAIIVVVACLWAPVVGTAEGVFKYIQEIWGFITPGIVTAFLVGLVIKKAPALSAKIALLLGPLLYALCRVPGWLWDYFYLKNHPDMEPGKIPSPEGLLGYYIDFSKWAFLHHMMIIFLILAIVMVIITRYQPLEKPVTMPVKEGFDTTVNRRVYLWGSFIIFLTAVLYIIFW
ncbi:MAG: sodium transporter [Phycisphaerae bacterium SM23_30]|nr:MAG: sodium transporter [Phycisphaerae bacterium SM23_30]